MHELSIAMSIVEMAAEEVAERGGTRVHAVHLKIGQLSGVVGAALRSAFEMARESETALAAAVLRIEEVPVTVRCIRCDGDRVASFPELRCRVCGASTPHVLGGRELEVVALEIES
ncbi:MAG TPA: hydrogenase maturation nickel metallochaperone HypA [Urbifossiella sp.]|jgi:hydrogenase nickel incorporation protein HypA/HybF|nr:hydrogenase maturation nickel metallochaperone HypA [Urbifossiella sp.]